MEDRDMKCYKKDYPRPQFVRDNWVNLNGTWDFGFDDANQGEKEKWYEKFPGELKIEVPFTYETKLSGIQDERRHDNIWYHKTITVDASKLTDNRLLIHFEGSDFHTKLWVNGVYAGDHKGGYARFSFDITELVKDGENELVVKVEDSFDTQQPRGKQRWIDENFGCWYVQTTGIWKTVWTEYVPKIRLDHVKMTPNLHDMALELEYQLDVPESELNENLMVVATITFGDMLISKTMTVMTSDHIWKVGIDAFQLEGIIIQEPFEGVLVLLRSDRAGAVDKRASHLHIFPDRIQDLALEFHDIFLFFLCHFITDIRLSADDAKTGAGNVRQKDICLLLGSR